MDLGLGLFDFFFPMLGDIALVACKDIGFG